ncbi:MAG: ABC transporter ATP-binding protein [Xanthobacteraceae bacterium]
MPPLIELIHIRREFDGGRIVALDDLSLEIERGNSLSIIGPSGSGKSTLLNLMCGLDRPSHGVVRFDGNDVRTRAGWAHIRARRVGIVFQSFCLISTLNARENVEVAMMGQIAGSANRRKRAMDLLERMGLANRIGLRPAELSGGERQRVAIARALANGPDVLVADEPTGSLDQKSSRAIMAILAELQQTIELTLVLVTHDQSVAACCRRQIELIDGRIVGDAIRQPGYKMPAREVTAPARLP